MRVTHNAGALIREARQRLGWSQLELAAKLAVSQPAIAHWESGAHAPRWALLPRIAELLGIPREDLSGSRKSAEKPPYVALLSFSKWVSDCAAPAMGVVRSTSFVDLSADAAPVAIKVEAKLRRPIAQMSPLDLAGRAPKGHGSLFFVETRTAPRRP